VCLQWIQRLTPLALLLWVCHLHQLQQQHQQQRQQCQQPQHQQQQQQQRQQWLGLKRCLQVEEWRWRTQWSTRPQKPLAQNLDLQGTLRG
jgi:hypothetical protein